MDIIFSWPVLIYAILALIVGAFISWDNTKNTKKEQGAKELEKLLEHPLMKQAAELDAKYGGDIEREVADARASGEPEVLFPWRLWSRQDRPGQRAVQPARPGARASRRLPVGQRGRDGRGGHPGMDRRRAPGGSRLPGNRARGQDQPAAPDSLAA